MKETFEKFEARVSTMSKKDKVKELKERIKNSSYDEFMDDAKKLGMEFDLAPNQLDKAKKSVIKKLEDKIKDKRTVADKFYDAKQAFQIRGRNFNKTTIFDQLKSATKAFLGR
ncbi:MAG: hypothetical protein LBK26_02865 [Rickettsiales bacterium]|jgi:hypothetical protein|nr:hypothetical protein [Rickettsiales bacterium]